MKYWISKYALSQGIYSVEGDQDLNYPNMIIVRQKQSYMVAYHGEGKDWHRTENEAKAKGEEMRVAKIASLKKQISKLEKLKF